jgi:hypothetical protein
MPSAAEIIDGPIEVASERSDTRAFNYRVKQGGVVHDVLVVLPAELIASPPTLPPLDLMVEARGRPSLERALAKGRIPKRITLSYMERDFGDDGD